MMAATEPRLCLEPHAGMASYVQSSISVLHPGMKGGAKPASDDGAICGKQERNLTDMIKRVMITTIGVALAALLMIPATASAATSPAGTTSFTVKVEMTLDCSSMTPSVHSYAVAHGYCAGHTSLNGPVPLNTVDGNCGDSYLYMSNAGNAEGRFYYGFYSTDGTVYYRDLVVSWANWTTGNYGNYVDAEYMWSAGYDNTKYLRTAKGFVTGVLSGNVDLWWGGICTVLYPTSSTTVN